MKLLRSLLIAAAVASGLTSASALANPPLNCAGVGTTLGRVGENCKACHQDFRN